MTAEKIHVGIVGASVHYGWGARAHMPALLALPELELTAVCTAHRETAEESAKHYGARFAFHDFREMVGHPDIDLVIVCVKVPSHHEMVTGALRASKHVYSEWPLGANLGEAETMSSLAGSTSVRNMIGLQAMGDPGVMRLKELMDEGYVGEVLSVNMVLFQSGLLQRGLTHAWMADKDKGANPFTIAAGHALDAMCYCVGDFQEVSARLTTQASVWETSETGKTVPVTSPDNTLLHGTLTNGAVASVHVALVPWFGSGWKLEIYGREGTIVASTADHVQYGPVKLRGGHSQDKALEELAVPERLTWVPPDMPKGVPFNVGQMFRKMGEAITTGDDAEPDFQLALKRHSLLDAIQRSSDSRQTMPVPH